jgi:hypothetical protein
VVFGDKKVSRIPERYVGIYDFLPVQASRCHMTTHVFYVTVYKKCTQTLKILSYQWVRLRYAVLVSTVVQVHFLNLKSLVCILISMGSTWDIGTKFWYVLPQGFESQMCALTFPTIFTIGTVTKVVRRIKQWRDFPHQQFWLQVFPKTTQNTMSTVNPAIIVAHVITNVVTHVIARPRLPPSLPRLSPTATATATATPVRRHPPA